MAAQNWSRNVDFASHSVVRPTSADEVAEVVTGHPVVGVVGTAHSFNTLADTTGVMIATDGLDGVTVLDATRVRAGGGIRYHVLSDALHRAGLALHNLPSIPHFSVMGACGTGTHGSGDGNGALHTAIEAIELVDGRGRAQRYERGDRDFGGVVVHLGALGVVTAVELSVEPTYEVAQELYLDLTIPAAIERLDQIMGRTYSVSLFTDWQHGTINQVWFKHRLDGGQTPSPVDLDGATAATVALAPSGEDSLGRNTAQLLQPGPWHERLPHIDPSYDLPPAVELQTEYFVPRCHGPDALAAVAELADLLAPVIRMGEIRTVAADDAWLSPFRQDALAIHFSWRINAVGLDATHAAIEDALSPFGAVPHWGKLYGMAPSDVSGAYASFGDFADLAHRLDPDRRFRNTHLVALLG